ncbi:MAG: hypothetical protein JXQ73_24695 [Phycisphaerae bacterium]|nr:hypothetical protein [Phycisphaerae bacterium]
MSVAVAAITMVLVNLPAAQSLEKIKEVPELPKSQEPSCLVEHWDPTDAFLADLVKSVDGILKTQDPKTGRFGTEPWICRDQNVLLPLAAAWSIKDDDNPWYHNPKLLEAIMDGGDALVDDQDKDGKWTFRKKDGSTWGQIYMPWTYSRWVRAFLLVKDAMPAERRAKWERGLVKGYEGISRTCLGHVHNIPSHHAMGLYAAGIAFNRDEWKKQAAGFLAKVVAKQSPDGWWSEHVGPVVLYNAVYVDALGTYYAMSGDPSVLEALRRSAVFHANMTYPDGSSVETVDERNPYHHGVRLGNVGFSMTPEGRGYLRQQHMLGPKTVDPDHAASFLLYGKTGKAMPTAAGRDDYRWTSKDGKIVVLRKKPWFVVASAYTAEVPQNRWIQDRQNFVSVYHDKTGLILGGGNTKLQPYWSNFSVGDPSLLTHKKGDTSPKFIPPAGLIHVPTSASVKLDGNALQADLAYGQVRCRLDVTYVDAKTARVTYQSSGPWDKRVEAHVTLLPHIEADVASAGGQKIQLTSEPFDWSGKQLGDWVRHAGWQLSVPNAARLLWPKMPHNPYRKAGDSTPGASRIVLSFELTADNPKAEMTLTVP